MNQFIFKNQPLSLRLFTSLILCVMALAYASLLGGIWIETQMMLPLIIEGYGDFEVIELTAHSFKYLFWFIGIFSLTVFIFLLTSACEKVKRVYAVAVPLLIVLDITSAWLVRYHDVFAIALFAAGFLLAVSFLTMFCRIQYDLWMSAKKMNG